jgi:oligopeptidase B
MRKLFVLAAVAALLWLVPASADIGSRLATPPKAEQKPHVRTLHGETVADPYFWLREKGSPDVTAYLEAENAYAAAATKPIEPLREKLYKEFLGRIQQTDLSVPYRRGNYYYYNRTEEGKQYPIVCRKRRRLDAAEEVMLDVNELAKGQKFLSLGAHAVSEDGNLLAYATDNVGFREYTLYVKDLRNRKLLPDKLEKVSNPQWSADGRYLFYTVDDTAKRACKVYRHVLGTPREQDQLLYHEKNELFRVGLGQTLDRKYLTLSISSSESSETHFLPTDQPTAAFQVFRPREAKHRYRIVGHNGGSFYALTNKDAKNFRLIKAPVADPANWQEVIAHRPDVLLRGVTIFGKYMVVDEKTDGLDRLLVRDFAADRVHVVSMPEPTYSLSPSTNAEFDATTYRFGYASFTTPQSVYDYDLVTHEKKLLKRERVLGDFDPKKYRSERVWVTARDGVKVPMSLVYRADVKKDGSAPCLLYGYGSYGSGMSASFAVPRLSLLDRGVVYALAHIRGGNEMGEPWHDDGKMMRKKNTFTDFIDCGNWLCDNNYTRHEKLAIQGGSAGGLLVGATLNLAPANFCKAAVLQVPFVDVINTMLDETLPLTVGEFLEWGNPKQKKEYDYMKSYCPYSNLAARPYPSILVTTSLNDSQVMYWEPAKYVAKLRTLKTDTNPLLFKCEMAGGHGGRSGRYDALKDTALIYAFLLDQLGVTN